MAEPQPALASVEADLFGVLLAFHTKIVTLLRESSLDDEKLKVVADRIKTLLDDATAEMKATQQVKLAERLEAAYEERLPRRSSCQPRRRMVHGPGPRCCRQKPSNFPTCTA